MDCNEEVGGRALRMRLSDWVFSFIHGYRFEASKLKPEETECFRPYVAEQMLASPCQAEAMQFEKPYRLVLLFFFDKTKKDLLIHTRHEKWSKLDAVVIELLKQEG